MTEYDGIASGTSPVGWIPAHNTSSPDCWCEPEIEELENGNLLVIHRDKSEGN